MITSKLRRALQLKSPELYACLHSIELKAHEFVAYVQDGALLTYTTHGISHVSAVEGNYDWLVSDGDVETFTAGEIFVLLCATLFHDALMVPRRLGDKRGARDDVRTLCGAQPSCPSLVSRSDRDS